ncbi:transposase [Salmonella enterica subsp. enterica serovar Give]|nr:transposase [Salmonella enterica subsp. enterica serovar Give]MII49942.1 transposase [Salmonella enterica subsp. enterica serovar Bredeney]
MSEIKITGLDLVRANFYLSYVNDYGKSFGKIKLSRSNLLNWLAQQPSMTVAMDVCGVSHHWAQGVRSTKL